MTQVVELVLVYAALIPIYTLIDPVPDLTKFAAQLGTVLILAIVWSTVEGRISTWERSYLQ